jgi:hypothetical protein
VITFFTGRDFPVFLPNVLSKGDRVDLSQAERNETRKALAGLAEDYRKGVRAHVESRKPHFGSVRNTRAFAKGAVSDGFFVHVPKDINVKAIRQKLGLSQEAFALRRRGLRSRTRTRQP